MSGQGWNGQYQYNYSQGATDPDRNRYRNSSHPGYPAQGAGYYNQHQPYQTDPNSAQPNADSSTGYSTSSSAHQEQHYYQGQTPVAAPQSQPAYQQTQSVSNNQYSQYRASQPRWNTQPLPSVHYPQPQPGHENPYRTYSYTHEPAQNTRATNVYLPEQQQQHQQQQQQQQSQQEPPRTNQREGEYITSNHSQNPETLDKSYAVRPKKFFVVGRMFSVLFTEPYGQTATSYNDSVSYVKYGERVYTQVRRFIVVRSRPEYCYACPVFTYHNQGTLKPGVRPEEHAVVYTVGNDPQTFHGETGIVKEPIGIVDTRNDSPPLNSASRIYFGISHPIQMNLKVKDLGMVQQSDIPNLVGYWQEEQNKP